MKINRTSTSTAASREDAAKSRGDAAKSREYAGKKSDDIIKGLVASGSLAAAKIMEKKKNDYLTNNKGGVNNIRPSPEVHEGTQAPKRPRGRPPKKLGGNDNSVDNKKPSSKVHEGTTASQEDKQLKAPPAAPVKTTTDTAQGEEKVTPTVTYNHLKVPPVLPNESILQITADKQIQAYLDSRPKPNTLEDEEKDSASAPSPPVATRSSNRIKKEKLKQSAEDEEEEESPSRSTRSSKRNKGTSKEQPKRGNTYGIKHRKFKVNRDGPRGYKDGLTKSQADAIERAFSRHNIPSEVISSQYRYARNQFYENKTKSSSSKPPPPITNWDAKRLQEWNKAAAATDILPGGHWTKEEDDRIVAFAASRENVEKGSTNWDELRLPGRVAEQVKRRWENILDPNIKNNGMWTEAEMKILTDGQKELGNKWAEIAERIPGRNECAVKNRWYNFKTSEKKKAKKKEAKEKAEEALSESKLAATAAAAKQKQSSCLPKDKDEGTRSFTREDDILLMKGMMKHGNNSWKKIYADEPGLHHIQQSALKDRARNEHFQTRYQRAKLDPSLLDRVDELCGAACQRIYSKEKVPEGNDKLKGGTAQPRKKKIKSIAVPRLPQQMVVQPQKPIASTTTVPIESSAAPMPKTGSQESVINDKTSESLEGNFPLFYETLKKQEQEMQLESKMSAKKEEESKVQEGGDEDVSEVLSALFSMKSKGVKFKEDSESSMEEGKVSGGESGTAVEEYNNPLVCPYCSKRFVSLGGRQYHIGKCIIVGSGSITLVIYKTLY